MGPLRLFMKKDYGQGHDNTPFLRQGEEVRIGKISDSLKRFMLIDKDDNRHIWAEMDEYSELVEDKFI